ncbi:hypothetical protein CTAYLR_001364 [Chrysophaeum taylorii]|uniref:GOLD domain-containing protein n=1 Tax=Chrysophaeum taylorii TaxID=2483200 RepID=A0AAD7XGK6_9STRA|nr:hypothetical protein CTAYLR_001364 [Chrysophaeum taylorii]
MLRLVSLCRLVGAMFLVLEDKSECFNVEQPVETRMKVRYEIPSLEKLTPSETKNGVKVALTDRRSETVFFSKTIADHAGELELVTQAASPHQLCFKATRGPLRFDIDIDVGFPDKYYDDLVADHKMDKLQIEVVKLNDELAEILSEADYMKDKEVKFHKKSERVNLAAIWWPVLQLAILVVTALFGVKNLKHFFSAKSLY